MHKGVTSPDFGALHVLSNDPWQYVELSLRRAKSKEALSYWQQARRFAEASELLSPEAAPLPIYYAFLNASKALLKHKKVKHGDHHGVTGQRSEDARASLANETVKFQNGGILPALCGYFNESTTAAEYSLRDILWNIPFIHRAFCLSFTSAAELFIPLESAKYVRHDKTREAWFEAEIVPRFSDQRTLRSLPNSFETWDADGKTLVRRKKRFDWYVGRTNSEDKKRALQRLQNYHGTTRRVVVNIGGERDLWYLKKQLANNHVGARHTVTLMFAAMHRLSELSRYDPAGLDRHLSGQANWLLVEFINHAMGQFIDQIATEITGFQFWPPKMRS
ncbi:YaaC family protein [Albidovulum sediminis]|uniref:YaaC family protein n=1 Tax=Albidovulum sediminis TaxID=3066345 RepID=A0ABT2NQN3_9RHOB|nr:YaaC family protein [Defluviimonas sediminis]MCT8331206.1 YaaC family protein [Defluviimonas sediminis]